jgi:hypothetical protein
MKKGFLLLSLMLASCSRGEEFYQKRCVYNNYQDERDKICNSYRLSKIENEKKKFDSDLNLTPQEPNISRPAEPAPLEQLPMPGVVKINDRTKNEREKSAEEIDYEKWVKSLEDSVGTLE